MSEVNIRQIEKISVSLEKPQVINGAGVKSIEQTQTSIEDNGINIITVYLTDGTSQSFEVRNGSKGSDAAGGNQTSTSAIVTLRFNESNFEYEDSTVKFEDAYAQIRAGGMIDIMCKVVFGDSDIVERLQPFSIIDAPSLYDVPCINFIIHSAILHGETQFYWTTDGISTSRPTNGEPE